ncbi:MAG: hypothetical protein ACE3JU_00410 [Paenibacillus sp.]|uniref:hypothetical protein n=1 Tax=Paenibacillus sp. TaxID=58172 RepID=UPI003B7DA973
MKEYLNALEANEDYRRQAASITVTDTEQLAKLTAAGDKVRKTALRQGLHGDAVAFWNTLSYDVHMDYEKAKKALIRKFGDERRSTEIPEECKNRVRWDAIRKIANLRQGVAKLKDYILKLEDLGELVGENQCPALVKRWLDELQSTPERATLIMALSQAEDANAKKKSDAVTALARKFYVPSDDLDGYSSSSTADIMTQQSVTASDKDKQKAKVLKEVFDTVESSLSIG